MFWHLFFVGSGWMVYNVCGNQAERPEDAQPKRKWFSILSCDIKRYLSRQLRDSSGHDDCGDKSGR